MGFSWRHIPALGIPIVCTLGIRLAIIGAAPFTDDGSHVANAYHFWNHDPSSPPVVFIPYINLYTRALCWLTPLADPAFVLFRLADALLATGCTAVLYLLMLRFAAAPWACLATTLWALTFNHPLFIQAGMKNAFAPGFLLILVALLLLSGSLSRGRLAFAGVLLGLACMVREPLVMFCIPAGVLTMWRGSFRQSLILGLICVGTIAVGVGVIGAFDRVAPWTAWTALLRNYRSAGAMYDVLAQVGEGDIRTQVREQTRSALRVVMWAVPFWMIGTLLACVRFRREVSLRPLLVAALLLVAVPLPEFVLKVGFAYHLSAMFIGLSLLCAAGFAAIRQRVSTVLAAACVLAGLLLPAPGGGRSIAGWWDGLAYARHISRYWSPVMVRGDWSDPSTDESFYLAVASRIRKHSRPGETLMVSGYYTALYPLARRSPADPALSDVSVGLFSRGLQWSDADRRRLSAGAPDVFVETNRFPAVDLRACFERFSEQYEEIALVGTGRSSYGQFAARIWKRRGS